MARRYTYARSFNSIEGQETFTAHEWDSFDEARNAVEKGIHDRKLQLAEKYPGNGLTGASLNPTRPPSSVMPSPPGAPTGSAGAKPITPPAGNNTTGTSNIPPKA